MNEQALTMVMGAGAWKCSLGRHTKHPSQHLLKSSVSLQRPDYSFVSRIFSSTRSETILHKAQDGDGFPMLFKTVDKVQNKYGTKLDDGRHYAVLKAQTYDKG